MSDSDLLNVDETIDAVVSVMAKMLPDYMAKTDELMARGLKQMHLLAKGIRECCTAIEIRLDNLEARVNRLERGFE